MHLSIPEIYPTSRHRSHEGCGKETTEEMLLVKEEVPPQWHYLVDS